MSDPFEEPVVEPGNLRFLRVLVTVLTVVMIGGVVVVVGLLVTRLSKDTPTLPQDIVLPDGAKAQAVTIGTGWYAIVTEDQRILIYDKTTGVLKQEVVLELD